MPHWSQMSPEDYKKRSQKISQQTLHWSQMNPSDYKKLKTQAANIEQARQIVSTKSQASTSPSILSRIGSGIETGLRKFTAFSESVLDPFMAGSTLGVTKLAQKGGSLAANKIKQLLGETPAEREARHKKIAQREAQTQKAISPAMRKVLGTVGDVAGIISGLGTAQGIAKATVGKGLANLGAKGLAKRAGTEAATGAIFEGMRALTGGKSIGKTAKEAGKGALLFGVAGPLGEIAGAGVRRALPGALGHYAGNVARGGVIGAGFSAGENILGGKGVDNGEAVKNAIAFAAMELLTGGRYKPDFSKSYDMLGEVNRAYAQGKSAGVQLDTPFPITPTFTTQERQVLDTLQRTGQSLDDLEIAVRKRYNKAKDRKKLEESLNVIQQLRQKTARAPQVVRGGTVQTGPEPLQGPSDTISARAKIAVNEGPVKELSLPQRPRLIVTQPKETPPLDPATAKERSFVSNSALNAEVVPETMKQELRGNIPQYNPISNKETWDKATQKVTTNLDQAKEEWRAIESLASADDTALGEALIVDAIKRGDIAEANSLTADLAEKLTAAGQAVQAAAIFKRLTPEGMLVYAQRVINRINRTPGIKTKVQLTESEAKFIADEMQKIQVMPEGREKDVALARVMQTISNKVPVSLIDKSRALRNIALLGNVKTFMRNVSGNVLMGGADTLANTVGATLLRPLDIYLSRITGLRSTALPSLKTQAKGFVKGGKEAISDALGGITRKDLADKTAWGKLKAIFEGAANPIDTSLSQSKWETRRTLSFKSKPLRILENAVNTSLAVGDRTFSQAYYDDVLNQLKKVNNTETVTAEMKALAQKIAEERTYQDMNTISALAMGVKKLPQKIQNHPKLQTAIQIFVDSLLPYVKTPANILKRGLEYTPVGVIEGLLKLGSFKNAPSMQMQREIIDRISRGLVGTGLMVAGGMAGKSGLATGAPSEDKDVANFERSLGMLPYAIKSGDTYVSYDWAQPVSMPFGAGVQYSQKSGDSLTAAMDAAAAALNYYTDQPMLQSVQRFLGSDFDQKSLGQRTLEAGMELPKQFVPTLLNQFGQFSDKYQRELYSPNFIQNALGNPLRGKLPAVRENLPVKVDTLGRPVESFQGNNNVFNVFFNPANVAKYKPTPEAQMVIDIFRETGATEHFPRTAQKYIMVGGKKYELTAEEYTDLQRIIGELTRQGFSQIDPSLPTDEKIREMTKIMDYAGKVGRNYIRQQRGLPLMD